MTATVTRTRRLDAPIQRVWATLSDFGSLAGWVDGIDHAEVVSNAAGTVEGSLAVGTTRRVQIGRTTVLEEVTEVIDPRVLEYRIDGLPKVVRDLRNRWELDPNGPATTIRLITTVDCGPRPPQALVARVVARKVAGQSNDLLDGLARHLESTRA